MRNIIYLLFIFILSLIVLLILWINITPGYFQSNRCCGYGYLTDKETEDYFIINKCNTIDCLPPTNKDKLIAVFLSLLANIDFNKGTRYLETTIPSGQFCGGIAGIKCPQGYQCNLEGNYPDAGGECVKMEME